MSDKSFPKFDPPLNRWHKEISPKIFKKDDAEGILHRLFHYFYVLRSNSDLVINPNKPRQSSSVTRVISPDKVRATITDLSAAILTVISVAVRVLSTAIHILAVSSGLPHPRRINNFAGLVRFILSTLGRDRITIPRHQKDGRGQYHCKNEYPFVHNIFSSFVTRPPCS